MDKPAVLYKKMW